MLVKCKTVIYRCVLRCTCLNWRLWGPLRSTWDRTSSVKPWVETVAPFSPSLPCQSPTPMITSVSLVSKLVLVCAHASFYLLTITQNRTISAAGFSYILGPGLQGNKEVYRLSNVDWSLDPWSVTVQTVTTVWYMVWYSLYLGLPYSVLIWSGLLATNTNWHRCPKCIFVRCPGYSWQLETINNWP